MIRLTSPWLYPEITFQLSSIGKKFYENLKITRKFTEKVKISFFLLKIRFK